VAVVAGGCGTALHARAETQARAWARAHGHAGARVECTTDIAGLPPHRRSPDFLCLVHRGASCDELHVKRASGGRWSERLYRRNVACVLPA
jgi:hypothetical protein